MYYDIRHYISNSGADVFQRWLDSISDLRARVAVLRRIDRMSVGNFGDHKYLRDGVWELRLDLSGGIRVYYGMEVRSAVVLCAGLKRSQLRDLERAVNYWLDFRRRSR